MADLEEAKKASLELFKTSIPTDVPEPTWFTLPDLLTQPILNVDTLTYGASRVIMGTFVPGSDSKPDSKPDSWSTADQFTTRYQNMIQKMGYNISNEDENRMTKLKTDNQNVLNSLVNTWEQTFGRITEKQLADANLKDKVSYVTAQFTADFMNSFNWPKFAADYNSAKADIAILSNYNSAKMTFGDQTRWIDKNIKTPSADNGGIQAFDNNNNKVWLPGFYVDPDFPSKFNNGKTVTINIDLKDIGTESSSFSIGGKAGGSFKAWFLRIGGSVSSEYNESEFKRLMSKVRITLHYEHVAYLATAPIPLTTNGRGWYAPELLKMAYERSSKDTGPFFISDEVNQKKILKSGGLQSVRGFLVSTMPWGTMEFESDNYSSFQKYFHTEAHADVSLFGFIPIASVNTSYTKSSSGATGKDYKMKVEINKDKDGNNLVVLGAALENPVN